MLDVVGAAWWMYNELERCGQELMVRGSAKSSREGAPMWCVKRLRGSCVDGSGLLRASLRIMACRVRMRWWAKARTA